MPEAEETNTTNATVATPVVAAPPAAAPPAAAPPAAAPPPAEADTSRATGEAEPAWQHDRLVKAKATAERKLLERLGAGTPEELEAKLAKLSELETASLSEQERQAKQLEELTAKASKAEGYEKRFAAIVDARFQTLTDEQQQRIDSKAAGDPVKRSDFMEVMNLFAASAPAVAPPPPKPGNTAPAGAPKPPPATGAPQTPYEQWQSLAANPRTRQQAAFYLQSNRLAIQNSAPSA